MFHTDRQPAARHSLALLRALLPGLSILTLAGCGGNTSDTSAKSGSASSASTGATGTVAAVSRYDAGPRAAAGPIQKELADRGSTLFQTKGCSACHGFGAKSAGPDLAGVSTRRTAAWMENQILHPEVMVKEDPIARQMFAQFALQMPNQGLTPDEARAIIEYLKHRDHETSDD